MGLYCTSLSTFLHVVKFKFHNTVFKNLPRLLFLCQGTSLRVARPQSPPHRALSLMAEATGNLGDRGWKDVGSGPLVYAEYLLPNAEPVDGGVSRELPAFHPQLWIPMHLPCGHKGASCPHTNMQPWAPRATSNSTVNKQNMSWAQLPINKFYSYVRVWQNVQKSRGCGKYSIKKRLASQALVM